MRNTVLVLAATVLLSVACRAKPQERQGVPVPVASASAQPPSDAGAAKSSIELVQFVEHAFGAEFRFDAYAETRDEIQRIESVLRSAAQEVKRMEGLAPAGLVDEAMQSAEYSNFVQSKLRPVIGRKAKIEGGNIARGYAVDQAAKVLRGARVRSFMITLGDARYAAGRRPDNSAWTVHLRDREPKAVQDFAAIDLEDTGLSMSSSGVSAWAKNAIIADTVDDFLAKKKPRAALSMMKKLPELGAIIHDDKGKLWLTDNLKDRVRRLNEGSR